jgi:iron-sulfur cluster repair protein YtfE (RIC family)
LTNIKEGVMNAFELLKKDHEKVAGIFEKLEPTTERALKTREELFTQLKQELDVHAEIEETIFYPAIKEADETREITLEAYEEHAVVKRLLSELEAEAKDTEEWKAKLTVLKENVEHHVEEEEGEMFPKAKKVLSKDQVEELGTEMQEAKKQLLPRAAAG